MASYKTHYTEIVKHIIKLH